MPKTSGLLDELQQTRPFRSPAVEASLGILRTSALIRRALAKVVEPSGLTPAQYNVLRILRGAGAAGLPTLMIRDRMVEEAPGITRLADKLLTAGYVRRSRTTPDRRQVICFITTSGLALLRKLDTDITTADEIGATGLTMAEQRSLIRLLDKVRTAVRSSSKGHAP